MFSKLNVKTLKIVDLNIQQKKAMFEVFSTYYNNVNYTQFENDLLDKDSVFLLYDYEKNQVRGFSTIVNLLVNGHRGLFSGDTIIEKEYWGDGSLGVAFLKYLFIQKLKKPLTPLYWFLISKGFKTYLLMANNFTEHWPRYESEIPKDKKEIINSFASNLYGRDYEESKGIISFKNKDKDSLKDFVAPITEQMLGRNNRIKFFQQANGNWQRGDELCCIAEMSLLMPLKYQWKLTLKTLRKLRSNQSKSSSRGKQYSKGKL